MENSVIINNQALRNFVSARLEKNDSNVLGIENGRL